MDIISGTPRVKGRLRNGYPGFSKRDAAILRLPLDGKGHTLAQGVEAIAWEFKTTEEERNQLLPSGRQRRIYSRVGWAKTYLLKAGLLEARGRGRFRITGRGQDVLKDNPARIDMEFLKRFREYNSFAAQRHDNSGSARQQVSATQPETTETPEELLEESYQELRGGLADDLLEHVKS